MTHAFTCDLCAHTGVFGFRLFGERTTCLDEAACAGRIEDAKKQTQEPGGDMTTNRLGLLEIRNTLILPLRIFRKMAKIEIMGDRFVPEDRIYLVDENGRILCYALVRPEPEAPCS